MKSKLVKIGKTGRGFKRGLFKDRNDHPCSIQESSLATEHCIWFGCDDAQPQILAVDAFKLNLPKGTPMPSGWVPYEIPPEVLLSTRMHLTQDMVKQLLPLLNRFAKTGSLS